MILHSPVSIQNARLEIVDTPLMLISIMGQVPCQLSIYILKPSILPLWVDATMQPFDCWMGKTVNCWHSVDSHLRGHLRGIPTVIGGSTIVHKMHTVINGSQYRVSTYYQLHPKASRHLSFCATTIQVVWMMNDIGSLHFVTFCQQFMA